METSETRTPTLLRKNPIFFATSIAITLVAYLPALNGGFVWDDDGHVCPAALRSLAGLRRIWTDLGATQQYYPILHSAFWLEYKFWGQAVLGYHVTNVILHACSGCLVALLMRRLSLPGSFLAAAVFALHPVCVESVAWISEQKNTLSTVFALLAANAYLDFNTSRSRSNYSRALVFFCLALLTKSVTAMLPFALLSILWWKRGILRFREDVLPLAPWVILGAASGLFTAWVERVFIGAQGADFALSLGQRMLLAGRVSWFYLWKLFWPANLSFIYPRWSPDPTHVWEYLFPAGMLTLIAATWSLRNHSRAPLAALLAFLALLFPVLGFVNVYPFRFSFVADHFQYLASLAIIVPVSAGLSSSKVAERLRIPRTVRIVGAVLLIATLGVLTWNQSKIYRDNEVLYRETIARNPTCWLALNNLGNIIVEDPNQRNDAIQYFREAVALKPDYVEAHFNLANSLAKTPEGRSEAILHYQKAAQLRPSYAEAHNNLGSLLARAPNQTNEAILEFQIALQLKPDFAAAHSNLATALARIPERAEDARNHYRRALDLDPDSSETHFNFANFLSKSQDTRDEAISHYESALKLAPDYAEAHFNLAVLLAQREPSRPDAISHCEAALRLHPEWTFARRALERMRSAPPP